MKLESTVKSQGARHVFSLLAGLLVGIIFSYLLFKLTLPSKPFIYVAF